MNLLSSLQKECPGFYGLLSKLFSPADLSDIEGDYGRCAAAGANAEEGFEREEGVSFRPRIARIVTILIREAGIRDVLTVRAAIYASAVARSLRAECAEQPVRERISEAEAAREQKNPTSLGYAIAAAVEIDSIRHLHMASLSPHQKEQRLLDAKELLRLPVPGETQECALLRTKLSHAIDLQVRGVCGESPDGGK